MKLFYFPGSCALAPHIVLEWLGESFEAERVVKGNPEIHRINPLGVVPALQHEGKLYTQADAILHWLAANNPEAVLAGGDSPDSEYEINTWMAFFTGDLHPAFFPFFNPQRYTPNEDAREGVKEAAELLVAKYYEHLETHLDGRDVIVGRRRSIVDAYAIPMLRWGRLLNKSLSEYPNLNAYLERWEGDDGVRRALVAQGLV